MRFPALAITGVVLLAALTGCARLNTILRKADLNKGNSLITDAKQRVVTNIEVSPSIGTVMGNKRVQYRSHSAPASSAIPRPKQTF